MVGFMNLKTILIHLEGSHCVPVDHIPQGENYIHNPRGYARNIHLIDWYILYIIGMVPPNP